MVPSSEYENQPVVEDGLANIVVPLGKLATTADDVDGDCLTFKLLTKVSTVYFLYPVSMGRGVVVPGPGAGVAGALSFFVPRNMKYKPTPAKSSALAPIMRFLFFIIENFRYNNASDHCTSNYYYGG